MPIEADRRHADAPGAVSGRSAIPVAEQYRVATSPRERMRLATLARKLLRNEPALNRTDVFGPRTRCGLSEGPALLLGNQREIGLFETLPEQAMEHRIAMLAESGDFLAVERASPAIREHLTGILGLDGYHEIELGPPPRGGPVSMARRCRENPGVFRQLIAAARNGSHFQLIPHIGTGSTWLLAASVAQEAGVSVDVAAPPPRLTKRVNDKIWFANRVREVLGRDRLPPTFAAFGPAAVAARIAKIARSSERVVVKIPDSSGSLGNVTLDAELVGRLDLSGIRGLVLALLRSRGWPGRFPLLVGVWEGDVVASPSLQLWVPRPERGQPLLEGIFEQRVSGPEGQFVGAVPSRLPASIRSRLADEAVRLALLFQALGWFGRCSFDCLVTGGGCAEPELPWIECNGRWGGVSVPMTFANRLTGNHAERGFVVVQDSAKTLAVHGVEENLDRLGQLLLRRGEATGVLPLSAAGFDRGRGIYLLSLAETQVEAEALAHTAVARLTG